MRDSTRGRSAAGVAGAVAVLIGLGASSVVASTPEERRDEVEDQIEQQRDELTHSTDALAEATEAFEAAQAELPAAEQAHAASEEALGQAQQELAEAQQRVEAAEAADERAAQDLAVAEQAVDRKLGEIDDVTAAIDVQRGTMSNVATRAYQSGANSELEQLARALNADSVDEATTAVDYTRAVMGAQDEVLSGYRADQATLANERVALEDLEADAQLLREQAAERVDETKQLEASAAQARDDAADRQTEADQAKAEVEELVNARDEARAAAEEAQEADQREYEELKAERDEINEEIRRLERERGDGDGGDDSDGTEQPDEEGTEDDDAGGDDGSSSSDGSGSSGSVGMPLSNPQITSEYGMRVHPITGVYKLHDGTDFNAQCGVEIRSVASGTVQWAESRGAYGNQIAVDHGSVSGDTTVTSYSHLSGYAVSSGAQVSKGEVIGYGGTTGSSTGCHLHLMMWRSGEMVNPMSVLG